MTNSAKDARGGHYGLNHGVTFDRFHFGTGEGGRRWAKRFNRREARREARRIEAEAVREFYAGQEEDLRLLTAAELDHWDEAMLTPAERYYESEYWQDCDNGLFDDKEPIDDNPYDWGYDDLWDHTFVEPEHDPVIHYAISDREELLSDIYRRTGVPATKLGKPEDGSEDGGNFMEGDF